MRRIGYILALSLSHCVTAGADELQIDQAAKANYAFVAISKPGTSSLSIDQHGNTNVISSVQITPDLNTLTTTQSGWSNTITIYQNGSIDYVAAVQSGPYTSAPHNNPSTSYDVRETEQGFLATFESGDVSIVSLTSENMTYVSRFGRRR